MRLFVALHLTAAVRERIGKFCAEMRALLPDARWVRVEGIHVTLKFIGHVDDPRVPLIRQALAAIHSPSPVTLDFHGAGFFPNAKRAKIFWAGIDASPNLAPLAGDIEAKLEPLGITRESRDFRPHLTLARIENPRGLAAVHANLAHAGDVKFGKLATNEMHLMQSELGRGGARYTTVETFVFADEHLVESRKS